MLDVGDPVGRWGSPKQTAGNQIECRREATRKGEDMASYTVSRLEEIPERRGEQNAFRPVREHFGIQTFGVIASTAAAEGDLLIKEHDESAPESGEELYVVLSGRARFVVDGQTEELAAGTFVHVPAGISRVAHALQAGTTVMVIGAGPSGTAYEPSGWEAFEPLFALYEAGDYAGAADRAAALLDDLPRSGFAYYNAACFESRAGRPEAALAHLQRAVELAPSLAELVADDDDLVSLRDRPEFAAIAGS
jgi:mannose-6-phosphate isomerase-like protein (cupin superfamily)